MTEMYFSRCTLLFCMVFAVLADDPIVTITETEPVTSRDNTIIADLNNMATLTCVVQNRPVDVEVKWVRFVDGQPIPISSNTDSSDAHKYSIDKPSPTAWRLMVRSLQLTDEGEYACRVQVTIQNYARQVRKIVVVEKPQIADLLTSNDLTAKEGDNVRLSCNATGRPFPVVKWMRLAGQLLPDGGQELRNYILNIPRVQPEHRGYYKCLTQNYVGSDERLIFMTVQFYPRVTVDSPVVLQKVGYRKQLHCFIQAFPIPDTDPAKQAITWLRNSDPIVDDGHFRVKSIQGASSQVTSTLFINGVRPEDFATYTCSAKNTEGQQRATVQLQASDIPTSEGPGTGGAAMISVSITTVLLLLSVCLLH